MTNIIELYENTLFGGRGLQNLMDAVDHKTLWERHDPTRKEAFFNKLRTPYQYSDRIGFRYQSFPEVYPELNLLWDYVEWRTRYNYDVCFINKYEGQESGIGWHRDDSPSIDPAYPVSVLALGTPRATSFRAVDNPEEVHHYTAQSGEILMMLPGTNQRYEHAVLPGQGAPGVRYSLVFRKMLPLTGKRLEDYQVYGEMTQMQRAKLRRESQHGRD